MKGAPTEETRKKQGLSRHQRVTNSREFREAFASGLSYPGRYMVMWLRPADNADLRLGVVVSKRTLRKACDRARAKRLLRESFRLNREQFHGKYDIVLVGRRRIQEVKRNEVDQDLLKLAVKAGLITDNEQKPEK